MSHISKYGQKISDIDLFCEKAREKGYKVNQMTTEGRIGLYGSNSVPAIAAVHIDGWRYPLAIDKEGNIHYDHWGSKQGTMELLGELCRDYNLAVVEKNIPFDQVQNYYTEKVEGGMKMVLEYE